MSISMRHTKMKADEVALLAGEVTKPTWQSRNEGIHERVSFEDTIWGFNLAGGSYYQTPIRVTYVKPGSRAEMANVRPGDLLLSINGIDTSTMTIQEAHNLIVESGINIKLHVTAPEDLQDSFYCFEDPAARDAEIDDLKIIEDRLRRQREYNLKSALNLKLQWPWVSKKFIVYRESNCFMVPSKYESTRRDKYPELPSVRLLDVVVLDNNLENDTQTRKTNDMVNGKKQNSTEEEENSLSEEVISEENNDDQLIDDNEDQSSTIDNDSNVEDSNGSTNENSVAATEKQLIDDNKDSSDIMDINNNHLEDEEENLMNSVDEIPEEARNGQNVDISEQNTQITDELNNTEQVDEMINELLNDGDDTPKGDEDNIINGVLNDDESNSRQSENER